MTSDDYCELCDLALSQCVHGRPVPVAPPATAKTAAARAPRARKTPAAKPVVASKPVVRRWTPPEAFKPLILDVLREAGGELDAEDLFAALELEAADLLLPGDSERSPEGELRWRYAARKARMALVDEGLMTRGTPGIWQLA